LQAGPIFHLLQIPTAWEEEVPLLKELLGGLQLARSPQELVYLQQLLVSLPPKGREMQRPNSQVQHNFGQYLGWWV